MTATVNHLTEQHFSLIRYHGMSDNVGEDSASVFRPEDYQNRIHRWNKKLFLREKIHAILFRRATVRFNRAMARGVYQIERYHAEDQEHLVLQDPKTRTVLFSVANDNIDNGDFTLVSGTYISRVYETTSKKRFDRMDDFKEWVSQQTGGTQDLQEVYTWYPARQGLKRYVVLFAKISSD